MIVDIDLDDLDEILKESGVYDLCDYISMELEKERTTYSAEQIYEIPLCATDVDWFLSYWQQYDNE